VTHERSSGPSHHCGLCCPDSSSGTYGRLRLPPNSRPLPGSPPVIGPEHSDVSSADTPGRGGSPKFPLPPCERSVPYTPGSSSGLQTRLYTPSMAFTVTDAARLSHSPARKQVHLTTRQASHNATDRSLAPPKGAFDAGLRPDPFPDQAASLLPGLLAATRTGLTPAGDNEQEQITISNLQSIDLRSSWRTLTS